MSGVVKNAVRTYIQKRERTRINRSKSFTQIAGGYTCTVSIKFGEHSYVGTGQGVSERAADQAAYNEIFCSMVLDGHEIAKREALVVDMYGEKATQVRSMLGVPPGKLAWTAPQIRQAVVRLRSHRNPLPFGPLNEFAVSACGKRCVRYAVKTVRNSTPLEYFTTAAMTLPCGEKLETVACFNYSKSESKREAAKLLIDHILDHYDYVT